MEENTADIRGMIEHPPGFSPPVNMLIGTFERNLDSKSRLGMPAPHREKFGDSPLILLRWMDRSIAVFPRNNWLPYAEAIARLDMYTPKVRMVRRQMFANAREVWMDKEGRIIIPPDMVDYARLDGKVMVMGDWDKLTLCNFTYYRDHLAEDAVNFTEDFPEVWQLAKGQKSVEEFEGRDARSGEEEPKE